MAGIALSDIRDALSGLNGENSTPTSAARDRHIQRIVEYIFYYQLWKWRKRTQNVAFNSSGVSTTSITDLSPDSFPIPSKDNNFSRGEAREVVSGQGNDIIYTLILKEDRDVYGDGDHVIWLDGNEVDGYTFNISDLDSPTLSVTYFRKHDTLSSSTSTTYIPLVQPIALGAYAFMVRKQDIDRNNSKEWQDFISTGIGMLRRLESADKSNRLISKSEYSNHYLGKV